MRKHKIKITVSDDYGESASWKSLKDIESPTVTNCGLPQDCHSVLETIVADALCHDIFKMIEPEVTIEPEVKP